MNFLHTFYFDAAKEAKNCFNMVVNGKKISKIPVVHANENARGIKVILTNFKYDEEINVFAYFKSSSNDEVVRVSPYERNKNTFNLLYPEMEEGEYECEIVVSKGNNVLSSGVFKGRCEKTIRGLFFKDVEVKDTIEGIINSYSTYKTLYENKLKETEGLVDKLNKNMLLNEDLKNQEDIRLRNEALRIENETSRGLAEENRVSSFEKIVTQSEQISQNEIIRDGNEKTRAENEINRINDETTRKNNELVRIENENRRLDSDTKRAAIVEKIEDLANKTEKAIRDTNEQQKNIDLVKQDVKALSGNIIEKIEEVDSVLTNVKKQVSSINEEENTRNSNETTRIENETSRVDNENVRKKQEDLRVKEEDKRLANELERIDLYKKSLLLSKELTSNNTLNKEQIQEINTLKENLENKETQRETTMNNIRNMVSDFNESESIRVKSENTRTENEANRSDNELARVHTESVRVASETARDNNEQTRISNENERKNNEALRIKAEIEREKNNTIVKSWINNPEQFKGKSAYDLWIENGNSGSIVDFLQSLIGQKGADGRDGIDGKNADMPNIRDGYWYIGDNNTGIAVDNIDMDRINRMIDSKINDIIGTAPENLNTLEELAKAINNDGDFVNSVKELINSKADKNYIPNNIPAQNIVTDDEHNFVNNEQINKINNALTDSSVINDVSIQNGDGKSTITIQRVGGDAKEIEINSGLSSKEKENIENIKSEISTKADKTSLNNLVKTINSTSTGLSITKNDGSIEEMAIQFPIPDYNDLTNKPNLDIYQPKGDYITNEVFNNTISGVNASISTKADSTDLNELIKSIERVDNSLNITKKDGTKSVVDIPKGFSGDYNDLINKPKSLIGEDMFDIVNHIENNILDDNYKNKPDYQYSLNSLSGLILARNDYSDKYDVYTPLIYSHVLYGESIAVANEKFNKCITGVTKTDNALTFTNGDDKTTTTIELPPGFSGDYNDLTNKPNMDNYQPKGNYITNETLENKVSEINNLINTKANNNDLGTLVESVNKVDNSIEIIKKDGSKSTIDIPNGFSGNYNDLTNKPDLSNIQSSSMLNSINYIINELDENGVRRFYINPTLDYVNHQFDWIGIKIIPLNSKSGYPTEGSIKFIDSTNSEILLDDLGYIFKDMTHHVMLAGYLDDNGVLSSPIEIKFTNEYLKPNNFIMYGSYDERTKNLTDDEVKKMVDNTILCDKLSYSIAEKKFLPKSTKIFSGNYNDLINKPDLNNYQLKGDYATNQTLNNKVDEINVNIQNKANNTELNSLVENIDKLNNTIEITKKDGTKKAITLPQEFSGDYEDLINKPNLDKYQPKGDYVTNSIVDNKVGEVDKKLINLSSIVNNKADSNELNSLVSDVHTVENNIEVVKKDGTKSTITMPKVFSGDYNDLINKPDLSGFINISLLNMKADKSELPTLATEEKDGLLSKEDKRYLSRINKNFIDKSTYNSDLESIFETIYKCYLNVEVDGNSLKFIDTNDGIKKINLSSVAFSGDYNDLTNKPNLDKYQIKGDYTTNQVLNAKIDEMNSLISSKANSIELNGLISNINKVDNSIEIVKRNGSKSTIELPRGFSGDYNDLINKPTFNFLNEINNITPTDFVELIKTRNIFSNIKKKGQEYSDTLFETLVDITNNDKNILDLVFENVFNSKLAGKYAAEAYMKLYGEIIPSVKNLKSKMESCVKDYESVKYVTNTNTIAASPAPIQFWTGTQIEYDKLFSTDENTLYFIV